jgi:hypothetical protein
LIPDYRNPKDSANPGGYAADMQARKSGVSSRQSPARV